MTTHPSNHHRFLATALVVGAVSFAGCSNGSDPSATWRVSNDDFDDGDLARWEVHNPDAADSSIEGGRLVLRPGGSTVWYANQQAYHLYQMVDGGFAVTARVEVSDLQGGPVQPSWRLGGLLMRNPTGGPVNTYHAGFGTVGGWMSPDMVAEYKATTNGSSLLGYAPHPTGSGDIRLCRAGQTVRSMFRADGETQWTLLDERQHAALVDEVAVGPMAYNYGGVADLQTAFDDIEFATIAAMSECETATTGGGGTGSSAGSTGGPGSTGGGGSSRGATLPDHAPLEVVIVSDAANPAGLPDGDLTQPGELADALRDPNSGLNVASVVEVNSQCVDDALAALRSGSADVFVYFAHLPARECDGTSVQPALTAAVENHLESGGGVLVFHHGIYEVGGKGSILQLLGGSATSYAWNPTNGQAVVNVAPGHFVTTNGMTYPSSVSLGDATLGIPTASYQSFTNVPDERYPGLQLYTQPGEERELLFVSDYDGAQILGYDLRRPSWSGHTVLYQPGEYQPDALDLDGPNFQILANAIYYLGTTLERGGGTGGGAGTTTDASSTAGMGSTGGTGGSTGDLTRGLGSSGGVGGTGDPTAGGGGDPGAETCVGSFDGTGDITALSDEFDDPAGLECWQMSHEVESSPVPYSLLDVDYTTPGQLTAIPEPSGWYRDHSGLLLYKDVTGDFMLEVEVAAMSLADDALAPSLPFSAAGVLLRDPDHGPGQEDWVSWDLGAQWAAASQTAAKNTINSVTPVQRVGGPTRGRLRLCRLGSDVILARQLEGEPAFTVIHQYARPDLPPTVQAGLCATAWGWGSGSGPNLSVDPDLLATWDYARFSTISDAADCLAPGP